MDDGRISLKQALKETGPVRAIIAIILIIVLGYLALLYSVSHKLRLTIRGNLMDVQFKGYNLKCMSADREVGMSSFYVEMRDCKIFSMDQGKLIKDFVNPIKVGYDLRDRYWFIRYDENLDRTINNNDYNITYNLNLTGNYSFFDFATDDVADKKLHYKYLRMMRDLQLKIDNINLKNKSADTLVLGDGNIAIHIKADDWPMEYKKINDILLSPPKVYDIKYESNAQKINNEELYSYINNVIDDNWPTIYTDLFFIPGKKTYFSASLKRKNNEWSSITDEFLTSPKILFHGFNEGFYNGEKTIVDMNKETEPNENSSNNFVLDCKSQIDLNLNKEIFLYIIQIIKLFYKEENNKIEKDLLKKLQYILQNNKKIITNDIKFSLKKDDSSINFILDYFNIFDKEDSKGINLKNNTEYKYDSKLVTTEGELLLNDYSKLVDLYHDIYYSSILGSNGDYSMSKQLIKKLLEEITDKPKNDANTKDLTLTYKLDSKDFKNGNIGNMKIVEIEKMLSEIMKKLSN